MRLRDLNPLARVLLFAVGMALLATGCRSHRQRRQIRPRDDLRTRAEGHEEFELRRGDQAARGAAIALPVLEPARQAQIDLIYAYYKNREVDPAIDAADTFIRENPTNPRVDYAYYMKGWSTSSARRTSWSAGSTSICRAGRPINAKKSFDAFDELLKKYPHSQYAGDARQRMIFLRNRLADFELYVAQYYMRRGAYVGALNRAKFCIENYDGAPAVKDSMKIMVHALPQSGHDGPCADRRARLRRQLPGQRQRRRKKKSWWRRIL